MKLAASNIALKKNLEYVLSFYEKNGCSGIEIAPDLILENPTKSKLQERKSILKLIKDNNLSVTGLHSLLFQKRECLLFGNNDSRLNFINYLKDIMELCADLEGKQVVFGSPFSRKLFGKSIEEARKISHEVFDELSEFGKKIDVYFCIEPLDKIECEFINNYKEAIELADKINNKYFKINFDTKTLYYSKENLDELNSKFNYFYHFQISEEDLMPIYLGKNDHDKINSFIRQNNYDKFISIEMVDTGNEEDLEKSFKFVKEKYKL